MSSRTDQPLACDPSAIPEAERDRHEASAQVVFGAIEDIVELSDGYEFRLPASTELIEATAEFISRERLCCPFFTFELLVEADHGPARMKLTGGAEVKQYIEDAVLSYWDLGE